MYQRLKGTKDIFLKEAKAYEFIKNTFFDIVKKYNYKYLETPIIEATDLFVRTSGEFSDIVNKEMYVFNSKSGKSIALRPEATAPAIRAIIENKLTQNDVHKVFYYGNIYRYERPQKGRYREFRQGGIENLLPKTPELNFEILFLANSFLQKLQIKDYILQINNLGSDLTRKKYNEELVKYFKKHEDKLSEINKNRLQNNVLRILDDKEQANEKFIIEAPQIIDFLSEQEQADFQKLQNLLKQHNINFEINTSLVRGLDYYNDVVFEFVSTSEALGSKSTILAGGRYDGMVKQFSGPDLSSIGFAFGVERLVEIILFNQEKYNLDDELDILICYLNENEKDEIINIALELRKEYSVELHYENLNLKKMFKKSDRLKPKMLIFKELGSQFNEIKIKFLTLNKELELSFTNIESFKTKINEVINENNF
ncbi:histidine--tRNA ligase [Mycoplasma zalophi]|uniref:Histidine--tRNA ligase n=1 Tax=Mycoplasma zalophi TaxID=191287 RepID=A0ABS6DQ63_9MOLU|nr:histidine--tRNA ligase [Mycoplasma zalophi]MBU4690891.1 histidine--tRNA ligase [Mycoplasma zalophi]MBU4692316.1 histidine--tRNA ligase [Mycoplasma zalophi]